jgi:hypothetical protein
MGIDEFGTVGTRAPAHLIEDYVQLAQRVYALATSWAPTQDTSGCFDYATTSAGPGADYAVLGKIQSVLYHLHANYAEYCEESWRSVEQMLADLRVVENNLNDLAKLGGGTCQAAVQLKCDLKESFAVLKAALTLLKTKPIGE